MPPDVVGETLVAAIGLPLPDDLERLLVEQCHAAGAVVAFATAEAGDEDRAWAAMHRVRAGVAGAFPEFLRPEDVHDLRAGRVVLGVEDIDPRRSNAGNDQVAALAMVVAAPRAQCTRARVPVEVVQLIADIGHLGEPDDGGVARGVGVHVHDDQRIRLIRRAGEGRDVRELLARRHGRVVR